MDCLRALAEGGPGGKLTDGDHINAVATSGDWTGKTALDLAVEHGDAGARAPPASAAPHMSVSLLTNTAR